MEIVKTPKKLRDICDMLRQGNLLEGMEAIQSFQKLEIQKNAISAEIDYFSSEFEKAMDEDALVFSYWGQWYSSNIFQEHLAAYTFAAMKTHNNEKGISFLVSFLEQKLKEEDLLPHQQHFYKIQVEKSMDILMHGVDKYSNENRYIENEIPKPRSEFLALLQEKRAKLAVDSVEAANYILHFIYTDGSSVDFLNIYENVDQSCKLNGEHRIRAAKIYVYLNEIEKAKQCVRDYVQYGWQPVEFTQVMPLTLFLEYNLYELYTKDFLQELQTIPKT